MLEVEKIVEIEKIVEVEKITYQERLVEVPVYISQQIFSNMIAQAKTVPVSASCDFMKMFEADS